MEIHQGLSADHPLHSDPEKPWPYVVTVGYRATGRKIIKRRRVYVRATGLTHAESSAIRYCREQSAPIRDDSGRLLHPSRALSARPLDKTDRITT
ncbi:hypothetical protein [Kushneria pakistanensis]|uniref:hypothetical protein n=1 Tax=Kushneria pakistanensis TaxID=1508770 RepID=UPI00167BC7EE|nr:hypothetical protein [Kushneria pakistanensis]